jgi:transcription antitermination factor NusG|tara:strand:- start:40 stop:309 length:270 start_codon:yes stop_codon:yes gene_type:complete
MTETHLPKTTEMLHTLTLEQLNELKGQITQMIEMKGGLSQVFKKGQSVTIDKPRFRGMIGEIQKVNSKKCKVWIDDTTWNVPHSMLIHA